MGSHYTEITFKLIKAFELRGILISTESRSFMGRDGRLVKLQVLKNIYKDEETGEWKYDELFSSSSSVYVMCYIRDMWYIYNGWELPTGDSKWDAKRNFLIEKGDPRYGSDRKWYSQAAQRYEN